MSKAICENCTRPIDFVVTATKTRAGDVRLSPPHWAHQIGDNHYDVVCLDGEGIAFPIPKMDYRPWVEQ
jgi:hypothetical protein